MPKNPNFANRGSALEALIELANGQYRNRGIATIHKVPTAWIPIRDGSGRIVTAKVDRKASVDFLGVYRGRGVAFDAKHTDGARIRWDRVELHQAEFLDGWERAGGVAFILVQFGGASDACHVIPWGEWREARDRWNRFGAPASVAQSGLIEGGRVGRSRQGIALDYLAVVDDLWPWAEVG